MRLVVDVWVPGHPVTKGSVTVNRGGTGVRQAAKGYGAWSDEVRKRVKDAIQGPPVASHLFARIVCRFFVDGRDGDKLERAVWDAVTRAGAWRDDVQAVHGEVFRCSPSRIGAAGAHVQVWEMTAEECDGMGIRCAWEALRAYDRAMFGNVVTS